LCLLSLLLLLLSLLQTSLDLLPLKGLQSAALASLTASRCTCCYSESAILAPQFISQHPPVHLADTVTSRVVTMKLDPTVMRSMDAQDYQILEAVETGMKDHAIVPLPLVAVLANNISKSGLHQRMSSLLRDKLLSHERKGYDGYRLTNAGYDISALHHLKQRGFVAALGHRIGTGKESDVYLAQDMEGHAIVLKFHRLGRTSFRNVRQKRDYGQQKLTNQAHSWLFLSRLSALQEFAFLKALHAVGLPVPTPLAHNRHILVMSLVHGMPLYQILPHQVSSHQAESIYKDSLELALRLAQHGLVHGDLNEFNLIVDLSGIQRITSQTYRDDLTFVRHSGQSISGVQSMGALSQPLVVAPPEEEALPDPTARLSNGQAKPIVTLIDLPQMVSLRHPNAREYYQRDIDCLHKFFVNKLKCDLNGDEEYTWEGVSQLFHDDESSSGMERLDQSLRASGSSMHVAGSPALELYYFQSGPQTGLEAVDESESDNEAVEGDYDDKDEEYDEKSDSAGGDADEQGVSKNVSHDTEGQSNNIDKNRVEEETETQQTNNEAIDDANHIDKGNNKIDKVVIDTSAMPKKSTPSIFNLRH
jgi:RIO kinase 2